MKKIKKKMQQLKELYEILKDLSVFEKNEVKPHWSKRTRQITHKLMALNNLIEKYGLYVQILITLLQTL